MTLKLEKLWLPALIGVGIYCYPQNYWRSVWADKWFLLMAAMVGFLGVKLSEKYHLSVGVFVTVLLTSALWVFGGRGYYGQTEVILLIAFGKITAYAFGALLLSLFVLTNFKDEDFEKCGDAFAALCVLNSVIILAQACMGMGATIRGGMFGNPSMSGCFIAMSYPFLCFQPRVKLLFPSKIAFFKRLFYVVVPVLAVFATNSSQPVTLMVLVTIAQMAADQCRGRQYPSWTTFFSVSIFISSFALFILWLYSDHNNQVFDSSGRFGVWRMALTYWWHQGHVFLGQGTGISQVFLPAIQKANIPPEHLTEGHDWWLWFHSDWVQLLFENGIIGFFSGLVMYGYALKKSWEKKPWLFAATIGVGGCALFNFPVHFPMHAFLGAVVLAAAFDKKYLANNFCR